MSSFYKPERWFRTLSAEELTATIADGALVPAIRAYLVYMTEHTDGLPYNAQYLLREAAEAIDILEQAP